VNALERLMGLVLVMLATQMFLDGIRLWMKGKVKAKRQREKAKGNQVAVFGVCSLSPFPKTATVAFLVFAPSPRGRGPG
jgi:uncharacterized protein YhhL (DUF1145 family)